jgi:iron complex transport system permease protein
MITAMGEDFSKNLGLNYRFVLNLGLIIVSLISAITLITIGTIPFLGLVIPNIVSIYNGDNLKKNIPHTLMLGALFVLICDMIGRVIIFPFEISISLTVGMIGSGLFLYLIMKRGAYDV